MDCIIENLFCKMERRLWTPMDVPLLIKKTGPCVSSHLIDISSVCSLHPAYFHSTCLFLPTQTKFKKPASPLLNRKIIPAFTKKSLKVIPHWHIFFRRAEELRDYWLVAIERSYCGEGSLGLSTNILPDIIRMSRRQNLALKILPLKPPSV